MCSGNDFLFVFNYLIDKLVSKDDVFLFIFAFYFVPFDYSIERYNFKKV